MILVPRPSPQLPRTVAALRRAGFRQLCSLPVAEYESFTLDTFPANATALVLTSAAALTALMQAIHVGGPMEKRPGCLRFLPAWCVGAATARAARQAGLNVVYTGKGNAQGMAKAMLAAGLKKQKFLHLHASNAQAGWAETLTAAGHEVAGLTAYQTAYLHTLPATLAQKIRQKKPTHTLLFSPAAARHLRQLLERSHIAPSGAAVALSPAVARVAKQFWPQVMVCPQPSLAAMVNILKTEGAS